jgi:hypothetical protein
MLSVFKTEGEVINWTSGNEKYMIIVHMLARALPLESQPQSPLFFFFLL